jgi:hypothetical protein
MPKLKWVDVADFIDEAYTDMWHNASMLGVTGPDLESDTEAEDFQMALDFYADTFCESLGVEIKEKFGLNWTLGRYGRGGATIAPEELARYGAPHGGFGSHVNEDLVSFYSWHWWGGPGWSGEALQDYNRDYKILLALRYINTEVKKVIRQDWEVWWNEQQGEE